MTVYKVKRTGKCNLKRINLPCCYTDGKMYRELNKDLIHVWDNPRLEGDPYIEFLSECLIDAQPLTTEETNK